MPQTSPFEQLRAAVEEAAAAVRDGAGAGAVRPTLERPRKADFGDYSTNAAMLLAPVLGEPPRAIAERLGDSAARAARRRRSSASRSPGPAS